MNGYTKEQSKENRKHDRTLPLILRVFLKIRQTNQLHDPVVRTIFPNAEGLGLNPPGDSLKLSLL